METVLRRIVDCLQHGQSVALATVISRKGSLPMSQHAKMLVLPDGTIMGTIGGGMLEATVIREAQHALTAQTSNILSINLTADHLEADGLTCGGVVEILIECLTPAADITVFRAMADVCSGTQPAVIATLLNEPIAHASEIVARLDRGCRKMLIRVDGTVVGTVGNDSMDRQIVQTALGQIGRDCQQVYSLDVSEQTAQNLGIFPETQVRVVLETLFPPPTAYLFGGGHIAWHLSRILRFIGFEFVVLDDRQEFANHQRFPEAKACIVQDFTRMVEQLSFNPLSAYFIIVTRGHKSDVIVLEQALRTPVKYIGMIGSRRKITLVFQHLHERGFSQNFLDKVHAPIGIDIGADTPEEIAVSIAAELIKVRRCGDSQLPIANWQLAIHNSHNDPS